MQQSHVQDKIATGLLCTPHQTRQEGVGNTIH